MHADETDHVKVSTVIMYTIAITIVLCTALVLVAKGVDAMPYDVFGIVGAAAFTGIAVFMAKYVQRQH